MATINKKSYRLHIECLDCGARYTLAPAAVYVRPSDGRTVAVYGSDADFCIKCDSSHVVEG